MVVFNENFALQHWGIYFFENIWQKWTLVLYIFAYANIYNTLGLDSFDQSKKKQKSSVADAKIEALCLNLLWMRMSAPSFSPYFYDQKQQAKSKKFLIWFFHKRVIKSGCGRVLIHFTIWYCALLNAWLARYTSINQKTLSRKFFLSLTELKGCKEILHWKWQTALANHLFSWPWRSLLYSSTIIK